MKKLGRIGQAWRKKYFVLPPKTHPSVEYRVVFESLFVGTFLLIAIVSILLFGSYFLFHNTYVINHILTCALSLLYLAITYNLWSRHLTSLASKFIIFFYFSIASLILFNWGINTPFGLLLLAITIVLAGILLGARHTLYVAGAAIALIFAVQIQFNLGYMPVSSAYIRPPHTGDAIAYSTLISILALISWLFGSQTERLLFKNRQAEKALLKEKELLEIRVAERTEQLQKAQLKEMEQLYQFAEMGQLSAALLHDLANHLSVLTFDIADLKQQQHTEAIKRAEESVGYLEDAVRQVRKQLQGKSHYERFNIIDCVKDSLKIVAPKAAKNHTSVSLAAPHSPVFVSGDPLRLSHIITILIRNGIEAYKKEVAPRDKYVKVTIEHTKNKVIIRVRDEGSGFSPTQRRQLFAPVRSTKKEGLGIGLFIAKKITETHFKGTLSIADTTEYTEFILELPKSKL